MDLIRYAFKQLNTVLKDINSKDLNFAIPKKSKENLQKIFNSINKKDMPKIIREEILNANRNFKKNKSKSLHNSFKMILNKYQEFIKNYIFVNFILIRTGAKTLKIWDNNKEIQSQHAIASLKLAASIKTHKYYIMDIIIAMEKKQNIIIKFWNIYNNFNRQVDNFLKQENMFLLKCLDAENFK
ncbi:hypothetical protein TCON_2625 [Astathelohania contejeani]|uniref:Uncharacterized protein n=1 Tax=Astathelohania contejeani TaxID=164912 RepID=A0ABQ7HVG7_9MICR|nr:hypothetical protein TCON_2625 [Thelohania contejeani]